MNKKNIFDYLEDSEDGEIEMIDRLTPELSDEQFERILKMSERKKNIMRASRDRNITRISSNEETVSGVEVVNKRPAWMKILGMAAAVVLVGGCGAAFGIHLMNGMKDAPVKENNIAATTPATTTAPDNSVVSTATVTNDYEILTIPVTSQTTTAAEDTTTTTTAQPADDSAYEAECVEWFKEANEKLNEALELFAPIIEYYDTSDTFTINVHDECGGPGDEPVITDYVATYALYTNPKFNSLDEIRDFYIENYAKFIFPGWEYTGDDDMIDISVKHYFDTRVQPGDQINTNSWGGDGFWVPIYTEYNGKIYKHIYTEHNGELICQSSEIELLKTKAEYEAERPINCWEIENCTENSFRVYEFYIQESHHVSLSEYIKVNGKWQKNEEFVDLTDWDIEEKYYDLVEKYNNGTLDSLK